MSKGLQLGAPGLNIPDFDPDLDGDSPAKKRGGEHRVSGTNKAKRGAKGDDTSSDDSVSLANITLRDLRDLLDEQAGKILQANNSHSESLVNALEERQNARMAGMEQATKGLATTVEGVQERLAKLESLIQRGPPSVKPDDERRRQTLVFGGWERDTRRQTIVMEVTEALTRLGLTTSVDESVFTTGPRRSLALLNMPLRLQESDAARKARMHKVLTTVNSADARTSAGKKLWCSYSKTRAERQMGGHCSWIKRSLGAISDDLAQSVDLEYSTGSAWLGESLIASVARQPGNGANSHEMITIPSEDTGPQWVDLGALAKESGHPEPDLGELLGLLRTCQDDVERLERSGNSFANWGAADVSARSHEVHGTRNACQGAAPEGYGASSGVKAVKTAAVRGRMNLSTLQGSRNQGSLSVDNHVEQEFSILGWNVGGAELGNLTEAARLSTGQPLHTSQLFLLQEVPRVQDGWSTWHQDAWTVCSYQHKDQWRGTGVMFCKDAWSILRRVPAGKGSWFKLRRLCDGFELWLATFHFTPGCTVDCFASQVDAFLRKKPAGKNRIVVQGDANAGLAWTQGEGTLQPSGRDAKALLLLDRFAKHDLSLVPPRSPYVALPTSRPRQEGREGKQIDLFATSRFRHEGMIIHRDSSYSIGTDHELLQGVFKVVKGKVVARCQTKPRVWIGGPSKIEHIDQGVLEGLARTCTKPRRSLAYKDPKHVVLMFQQARISRTREAWKRALAYRRAARQKWEKARQDRALQGDWKAFQQSKVATKQGWEIEYADLQSRDPHATVHDHLSALYKGQDIEPKYNADQEVQAFTVEELRTALSQLKGGKSVGRDLTSKELLEGVINIEGGQSHLLEFMNRVLCTQVIPPAWNQPLLIVLPKTDQPASPSDLRPIALGSSASKLFSRLVLNRVSHRFAYTSHAQCAGGQRQCSDVIFAIYRLLQLEKEWKQGLVISQIDVSKAFDSLSRTKLIHKLETLFLWMMDYSGPGMLKA
ncbi:unnamed protein product [Symbiodinium sp. CCMP2592]|nr:unnamed protein product [Symbiodinium sp. CCMP2592]